MVMILAADDMTRIDSGLCGFDMRRQNKSGKIKPPAFKTRFGSIHYCTPNRFWATMIPERRVLKGLRRSLADACMVVVSLVHRGIWFCVSDRNLSLWVCSSDYTVGIPSSSDSQVEFLIGWNLLILIGIFRINSNQIEAI
jgi:hypothetical protein